MKKLLTLFSLLFIFQSFAQMDRVSNNETLKYRIHYGFLTAGYATLTTQSVMYNNRPHLHVKGYGTSSGAVKAFFKVKDDYESYIDTATGKPSFYIRNVSEGKYRRYYESVFNHGNKTVKLTDKLRGGTKVYNIPDRIQDMMSSFYYLRNLSKDQLKPGSSVRIDIWIDDEVYPFLLKVNKIKMLNTPFGKIETLEITPSVMSGRVFKSKEGVKMWVTNDDNHIPIQMKAELVVGAIKADLVDYSNVKYPLNFVK